MEGARAGGPLRIEVATSQIEGNQAVGWADPNRVCGCVAYCEPRDAFDRFVAPNLNETMSGSSESGGLPQNVTDLITGLKAAHLRLYRENHSLMKDPKWVRITAACADEERIYFTKTQSSWIYLVRGGRAFLVGSQEQIPGRIDDRAEALGGPEKLRLQVTSVSVTKDDQILLVTADADQPPDLHAIARLFTEATDLKRACDGLVNLLGLQAQSAAVVAFRYSPLMSGRQDTNLDTVRGGAILDEISEMTRDVVVAAQEAHGADGEIVEEEFAGSVEENLAALPGDHAPVHSQPVASGEATARELESEVQEVPEVAPIPDAVSPEPVALATREGEEDSLENPPRRRSSIWPILLITLLLFIAAAFFLSGAGWPDLVEKVKGLLSSGTGRGTPTALAGLLDATSDPPGAIIAVDGEKVPGRTPLHGLRIPPGKRVIGMYLGAAGIWVDTLDVVAGERTVVHAGFHGSLAIAARDTASHPRVWLEGQTSKRTLPTEFADLPAGWYRIFFEDDRIPLWERKVLVRNGDTASIEVNNAFSDHHVLLRVESLRMIPAEGLRPSLSDSVFVDRTFRGLAPLEVELTPGLHGVRVVSGGEEYCEVLRLPAGASRFITPQFGLRSKPSFHHLPPEKVVLQGPLLLAVEIEGDTSGLRHPQLQLPKFAGGPRAIPLVQVDSGENLFVGRVEQTGIVLGDPIPYYFSVASPDGEETVSDLFEVLPVGTPGEIEEASALNASQASLD